MSLFSQIRMEDHFIDILTEKETEEPAKPPKVDDGSLNQGLVMLSLWYGLRCFITDDSYLKCKFGCYSSFLWACQLTEAFTCPTWGYLNNQVTAQQAVAKLEKYAKSDPEVRVTIKNYHKETTDGKAQPPLDGSFDDHLLRYEHLTSAAKLLKLEWNIFKDTIKTDYDEENSKVKAFEEKENKLI